MTTRLTERLLFAAGVIDALGSVDAGSTQTDSLALERQRGTATGQRCSTCGKGYDNADPGTLFPRRFRVSVVAGARQLQHR